MWVAARLGFYSCGVGGCKAGFLLLYVCVKADPLKQGTTLEGLQGHLLCARRGGWSLLWGGFGAHWLGWAIWVEWVIRQMPGLGELLKG